MVKGGSDKNDDLTNIQSDLDKTITEIYETKENLYNKELVFHFK